MTTALHDKTVRVRFAPSPTGHLHIGSLRTALFNWLFARHNQGKFFLRIEDTDIERSKPEYTESLLTALEWVSLSSDEPYTIQTHSIEKHMALVNKLLAERKAYKCYCPPSTDVEGMAYSTYASVCRDLEPRNDNSSFVVRIKIPRDHERIEFDDIIRGTLSFPTDQFDDFVIARSDGRPVYNFVVVADDAAMKITHVIRGEDHISNTPKQIVIYKALGYTVPQFAHIPLILGPTGARLSKRDAATSALDYRKNGYLPEALCNYLVRLGWSHGDQEIFTRDELIRLFTLEAVGKKGALFDQKKLDWINAVYIKQTDNQKILDSIIKDIDSNFVINLKDWNHEQIISLIALYKERCTTLVEITNHLYDLYKDDKSVAQDIKEQWFTDVSLEILKELVYDLRNLHDFSIDALKVLLKSLAERKKCSFANIAHPIRIALTATTASPGVYELMIALGKEKTIERLEHCAQNIHNWLIHKGKIS